LKKLASILPVLALTLAACGSGGNSVAATVDHEDITVGQVESFIDPGEVSTISKADFAQYLGFAIQQQILTTAAESEFGIVIDEADVDDEADALVEQANTGGATREEFLATSGVTEELLHEVALQRLIQDEVKANLESDLAEPTQEEIDGVITEAEAAYCASHILVATEAEASDVLDRLAAGEQFADLATELSTDTTSGAQGGDLGCGPADMYVTEFADALTKAEVGVPAGPVETEFGFHVILLREDEIPTEEEIVDQLNTAALDTAVNEWFLGVIDGAEVTVDESYGTWDGSLPGVVPPEE
jgi:parvulin-like peptidyl-prolyl isomerase